MVLIAIGVTPLFWEGPWTVSDTDVMHESFLSVLGTTFIRQWTISPPTDRQEKRGNVESDTMMHLPFLRF